MILYSLKLTNFRNLSGNYSLSKGINVIIAFNGAGKTNFIEGINYLSTGKSFRTSNETYVINKFLKDDFIYARISGQFEESLGNIVVREVVLEKVNGANGDQCKKTLIENGVKKTLGNFVGKFNSVLFNPETINLVISSPSFRRRDLDDFISTFDQSYFENLQEYKKVVRNRNKLLEKINVSNAKEISFWNDKLIELGACIIHRRNEIIEMINPLINKLIPIIFNSYIDNLSLKYLSKFTSQNKLEAIKNELSKKIKNNFQKEVSAGVTLYGPHREDFVFLTNGSDLASFGSRGQQRLASFCYKIAQKNLIESYTDKKPILLLDDIFSELDSNIRKNVCNYLSSFDGQVVLTSLSENEIDKKFFGKCRQIII